MYATNARMPQNSRIRKKITKSSNPDFDIYVEQPNTFSFANFFILQPSKASAEIKTLREGIKISLSDLQFLKASDSIFSRPSGSFTEFREKQFSKVDFSIFPKIRNYHPIHD